MSRYGENLAESEALQDQANWNIAFSRADKELNRHKSIELLREAIDLGYPLPYTATDPLIQHFLNELHIIQDSSQK